MLKAIGFIIGFIPALIINIFGWALLVAFPLMWIWNKVLIMLFNLPPINYLQSFLLYIFCSILFKPIQVPPHNEIKQLEDENNEPQNNP